MVIFVDILVRKHKICRCSVLLPAIKIYAAVAKSNPDKKEVSVSIFTDGKAQKTQNLKLASSASFLLSFIKFL